MLQEDFFSHIESHYKFKQPFVAYRKPNSSSVRGMLQNDDSIHTVDDFTERGFIFSPFNSEENTIIFPSEICQIITSELSFSSEKEQNETALTDSETDNKNHVELVQKGIDAIKNSQLKKVVLSRVESVSISEDNPIHIFQSLLKKYTSAFTYIWYHPSVGLWLGATPETLLNLQGQRFKTMSLAGTQPYLDTTEVEWDAKNVDEQQVVTDFIEKELIPFTERLTATPAQTIKAGQLLHLQSQISGVLKSEKLQNVISTLHPTPAVCGLPKAEAKAFILSNENYNREFYTGFLGELNLKTSTTRNSNRRNVENNAYKSIKTTSDLYVNLRCMQIKEGNVLIYVGGGITNDSNPQLEWEETVNKTQTMKSVLY
ncbi:MAG: chorismate-binding protein [Psychroserpens sp.]|uniref:chorismate-binding protein n=1 Tax=Psychroserpens sp. TaxID=2020870 RepID=UPI003002FD66